MKFVIIRDIMSLGASLSWHEVLMIATRGKSSRLDAQPLLDYFKPLQKWLEIQNQNEPVIGWRITSRHETGEINSYLTYR